jgi:hypothetical protein
VDRDEGECIGGGSGARPAFKTERRETGGSRSGRCAVCQRRLKLDPDGGIPRHQLPEQD